MTISHGILHRVRNISDKSCIKYQNTILCALSFFQKTCCLCDSVEKCGRVGEATDDNTIQCMHLACWITKATGTQWEYIAISIILIAFLLQQWLCECTPMLHLYICCLYFVHAVTLHFTMPKVILAAPLILLQGPLQQCNMNLGW